MALSYESNLAYLFDGDGVVLFFRLDLCNLKIWTLFAIHAFQYSNSSFFSLLNRDRVLVWLTDVNGYADVNLFCLGCGMTF